MEEPRPLRRREGVARGCSWRLPEGTVHQSAGGAQVAGRVGQVAQAFLEQEAGERRFGVQGLFEVLEPGMFLGAGDYSLLRMLYRRK